MKVTKNIPLALLTLWSSSSHAVKLQQNGTCSLVTFIPFLDLRASPAEGIYGYGQWSSEEALGKASFSLMAAALMAKDHFNLRDSSVVPDLKKYESCGITIPDNLFMDSSYSRSVVVDKLINITRVAEDPDNSVCAVIGPIDPRANEGASVITENLNIPQIAYQTIDKRLERRHDFPTFIRGIPVVTHMGRAIADYVQRDIWERKFVGVIYDQSDYGEQIEGPMEDAEDELGYLTITEHVVQGHKGSIEEALDKVVDEGYRTVLLASDSPTILEEIAKVADHDDYQIIGDDYVWFFTGDILPPELFDTLRFKVDSPADKILRGAALITNYDPFVYEPEGDAFLKAWKSQGDEMLDRVRSLHPLSPFDYAGYYAGGAGYFQKEIPTEYASFLYDAIMNAGMSACRSLEAGTDHVEEVLRSDFQGASGRTVFEKGTNTRAILGVKFGVYNVRPGPIDEATNTRGYTRHLTAMYDGTEARWTKVKGEEFDFYDGTTNVPTPVRETTDFNFLSKGVRIAGFVLVGLSMFVILLSVTWVFVRRKERIVTASQPQFLYLLCFGAALQAASLIFISFDESYGWTDSQLDKACSAFPWFFFIGYLVQYCAIFSKLWRMSKLLSLRRRAVDFNQVIRPFALIITSSVAILIAWQVVNPFQWHRELTSEEMSEEPWVSYGQCESEHGVLPYILPLAFLFVIIMLMTLSISWKMRAVQSELSEAKWIFIAIFSHIQMWVIGIPVYLILNEISRDATYLISMALIFVFSNVFVILVIWPKMNKDIQDTFFGAAHRKNNPRRSVQPGESTNIYGLEQPNSARPFSQQSLPSSKNNFSSAASYNDDKLKIISLEAEIQDLKKQFGETLETTPEDEVLEADCEPKKADESEPLDAGSGLNQDEKMGEVQEADCEPRKVDESDLLVDAESGLTQDENEE